MKEDGPWELIGYPEFHGHRAEKWFKIDYMVGSNDYDLLINFENEIGRKSPE